MLIVFYKNEKKICYRSESKSKRFKKEIFLKHELIYERVTSVPAHISSKLFKRQILELTLYLKCPLDTPFAKKFFLNPESIKYLTSTISVIVFSFYIFYIQHIVFFFFYLYIFHIFTRKKKYLQFT